MSIMKDMLKPSFGGAWGFRNGETATTIELHGDGEITVATYQDPTRVLKQNRDLRNDPDYDGYVEERDLQMVAQILPIVYLDWLYNHGVDLLKPEHSQRALALLDTKDYEHCKVVTGKVSRGDKVKLYSVPSHKPLEIIGAKELPGG